MRFSSAAALLLLSTGVHVACSGGKTDLSSVKVTTTDDSVSYAIGKKIGENISNQGFENLNPVAMAKGISDAFNNASLITDEEIDAVLQRAEEAAYTKKNADMLAKSADALAKEEAFLSENGTKAGVITTASGLQYEVLKKGSGPNAKPENTVKVHYKGMLVDGTQFDSSYDRNEPVEIPLNQVIPGWTEGVALMNVGSKYKFYIPSKLGYGARGAGGIIGPNETLIFEVELLAISK
jgi:FKBP-type peptidyl-prolyl cis-trans isomerase